MEPTDRAAEHTPPPETQGEIIARLTAEKAEQAQEIAELKARLTEAEANAATDELTGLPKRKVALMSLEKELAVTRRGDSLTVVVMFDLDHFKAINDTDGHPQGDEVLIGFARKMEKEMRDTDTLSRWGGEEFLAVLRFPPDVTREKIQEILERYRQAVKPVNRRKDGIPFEPLTFSAGCIIVDPTSDLLPDEIIALVDNKLYEAKRNGRDRSIIASAIEHLSVPKQTALAES